MMTMSSCLPDQRRNGICFGDVRCTIRYVPLFIFALLPQSALAFRNTRSLGDHVNDETANRSSFGMGLYGHRDSAEIVVAATSPSQERGSSCLMQSITDATACGMKQVTSFISDAVRCGMTTCNVFGRSMPCPKRCSVTTESPNTCQVAVSCPFRVRVNVQGSVFLGTYETAHFHIEYVNHRCIDCAMEIEAVSGVLGNPRLRSLIDVVVEKANEVGNAAVQREKASLLELIARELIRSPAAYYIDTLGGNSSLTMVDLVETMARDASLFFGEPPKEKEKTSFFRRLMNWITGWKSEASVNSTQPDLCRQWLRITSMNHLGGDGENNHSVIIKEWQQSEIMRGYSNDGMCVRTYVAQCSTSTVFDSWLCNTDEPNVTQLELGRFEGSGATLTIAIPEGDNTTIFGHTKAAYPHVGKVVLEVVPAQTDEEPEPPVVLVISDFKESFASILCNTLAGQSWAIVRYSVRGSCRATLLSVLKFFSARVDVPLPHEAHLLIGHVLLHLDTYISGGNLHAIASGIHASTVGANAGPLITSSLKNISGVPVKIEESHVDIRFENKSIIIEPTSWVELSGSLDMNVGDR
eukprot:TRINITY_DN12218_c0_g1_i1.p1 TRINITY_DN12218_c0_g1~~TRINITY_DN12218_c0_g1_i1.p1  ORF type:complete len:581 (-),score=60.21 TRINITY_DN12218_c0_g1_i1:147-1889(-)